MRSLAEALTQTGSPTSHSVVSQMENGRRKISVDELIKLSEILDCPAVALLLPHGKDPQELIGTSASSSDTAAKAVERVIGELTAVPDWVNDLSQRLSGEDFRTWDRDRAILSYLTSTLRQQDIATPHLLSEVVKILEQAFLVSDVFKVLDPTDDEGKPHNNGVN